MVNKKVKQNKVKVSDSKKSFILIKKIISIVLILISIPMIFVSLLFFSDFTWMLNFYSFGMGLLFLIPSLIILIGSILYLRRIWKVKSKEAKK